MFNIGQYTVELRNSGASAVWCVYTDRTPRRNHGSNLIMQVSTDRRDGVPTVMTRGQQVKELTRIIKTKLEVLPC